MLKKWAHIPALVATLALPLLGQEIFVTPPDSGSTVVGAFRGDPFSAAGAVTAPAGTMMVLRASPTKFYAITRNSLDAIVTLEGSFPSLTPNRRINLPQAPVAAALSPDGQRLVVIAGNAHVINTATDTDLTPSGIPVGSSPSSVAISQDSTRAFVLSPNAQRLTALDLATGSLAATQTIPGIPSRVAVGPNGLVYVTAPNSLLEYDARTLTSTGNISLNAFPGAISFTPDGRFALLVNTDPRTQSSLVAVDLTRRTAVTAPLVGQTSLITEAVATSNTNVYVFSAETGRLYQVRLTPGSDAPLTAEPVTFGNISLETIRDIAVSPQIPTRYLFLTTQLGMFRLDVQTGSVSGPLNTPTVGDISIAGLPATQGVAAITALSATRTLNVGATTAPLVVRVTDASGNPVAGVAVVFSATNGGVLSGATATTNNAGLASAYVTAPAGFNGVITATATAAGLSTPATFTITVGTGGGGPGETGPGRLIAYRGSGQALGQFQTTQTAEPLQVLLRDAAGTPVSGASVTWAIKQGGGSITLGTSTTNESGIARTDFISSTVQPGLPYTTTIITATSGSDTVDLYITTLPNVGGTPGFLNIYTRQPNNIVIEGRAGETLAGAIRYDVVTSTGARVPFIGIRVETDNVDSSGRPAVECRGGTQYTDAEGVASCDLVVGNVTGEVIFYAVVAGQRRSQEPYTLRITQAPPARIDIVGGNAQSGSPGQRLSTALAVDVYDQFGTRLPNVDLQWEVLSGTATLADVGTRTDFNGRATAFLILGQTPGPVQVRVRPTTGTGSAVFTATISPAAAGFRDKVGDNQTVVISQPFGALSVRVVDPAGAAVAGSQVTFLVTEGSASPSTVTATTDSTGVATASFTAGNVPGRVVVQARLGTLVETFTLNVRLPGPVFNATQIVNAAGFQQGISPGSIAAISGTGFAASVRGTVTPSTIVGPLPYQLAGVEVLFNNVPAPIFSVTNNNGQEQVVVQVPYEVQSGPASVTIRTQDGGSTTITGVQILPVKPGIFEFTDINGRRYAVAVRPDGSYVTSNNPARRGEIIRFYVTGLGAVSPASGTNRVGIEGQNVLAPLVVGLNDQGTRLVSAQLLPGSVGVYVVAFEVPANTQTGPAQNFAIAVTPANGPAVFGNGSSLPVQ